MSYETQRVRKYATTRLRPVSDLNALMGSIWEGSVTAPVQEADEILIGSRKFRFVDEAAAAMMCGYLQEAIHSAEATSVDEPNRHKLL